jgi:hypothetical protein
MRNLIRAAQCRAARIAAGVSATRGQGRGAARAAREYLSELNLRRFSTSDYSLFSRQLDQATANLMSILPRRARSWGSARKLLNIFLRDALYTTYLTTHFDLSKVEPLLEIPLDSITTRRLRERAGRRELPCWRGVKHLTKSDNERFQAHASRVARGRGIDRVHLDTFWWGERSL